jgi:hypothetical protein
MDSFRKNISLDGFVTLHDDVFKVNNSSEYVHALPITLRLIRNGRKCSKSQSVRVVPRHGKRPMGLFSFSLIY